MSKSYFVCCTSIAVSAFASVQASAAEFRGVGEFIPGVVSESRAAIAYQQDLFKSILSHNYLLNHYSYALANAADVGVIVSRSGEFKKFVSGKVQDICLSQNRPEEECRSASQKMRVSAVEVWDNQDASFVLANWLYKLDGENWYYFSDLQRKTSSYFEGGTRKLFVVKGWDAGGVLANGLTVPDFPVVVDIRDNTVTLWTNELND